MTEPNNRPPEPPNKQDSQTGPIAAKPKRARWWLWAIVGLAVALFLLVAMLPTLLSLGVARSVVVSQVNKRLNGQLQINGWSLGWFSSLGLEGVSIKDDSGRQILSIPRVQTHLSLLNVIRGKYATGDLKIDSPDVLVVRYPDGSINWARLAKSSAEGAPASSPAPKTSEPMKVPNVSGHIVIANGNVTFEDQKPGGRPIQLRSIQSDVDISNINQPIANSFSAQVQIGANEPGTISASGSVGVVSGNVVSMDSANIDETLKIAGFDLGAANGFIAKPDVTVDGRGDTTVAIKLTNGSTGTASLRSELRNVAVAQGAATARTQVLSPDTVTAVIEAAFTNSKAARSIHVSQLQVGDSQRVFSVAKSPDKELAVNLPESGNPTGSGSIDLSANLKRLNDIAQATAKPSPNSARLQSGTLTGRLTIDQSGPDRVSLAGNLDATDITVSSAGQTPINKEAVKLTLAMNSNGDGSDIAIPSLKVGGDLLTLEVQNGKLSLPKKGAPPAPSWAMLRQAAVNFTIPSLPKLQKLVDSFGAQKPASGPPVAAAEPKVPTGAVPPTTQPMELTSGSATGSIQVSTDGSSLHAKPQITIAGLAAKQGEKQYGASSITLDSDATATASGGSDAVQEIRIARNDLDVHDLALDGKPYPDKLLHIGLAAVLQPAAAVLDLQNATVSTSETKAVTAVLKGRITKIFDQRQIDNVLTADVDYDADSLLKLVTPFLSADMQKRLKDASAAGKYHKQFAVRGSYPANQPFNVAVQGLTASGDIQVDKFDGAGASIQSLAVPFSLSQGIAKAAYADKPEGQNLAQPTGLNGGKFSIAGAQVDLRTAQPTLSLPPNSTILDRVQLNPVFASWTLGTFLANPVFVGADKATGSLTIVAENCDKLILGSELTQAKDGSAALNITIKDFTLSNRFLDQLASVSHTDPGNYRGDVQLHDAIAAGTVNHKMTIVLGQGARSILMHGDVHLADRQMNMVVSLPWKLLGLKNAPKELMSVFPDSIDLPLTGTVENPQLAFDFNKLVQQSALKGLTGQGNNDSGTKQDDPLKSLGDLINNATKKKNK